MKKSILLLNFLVLSALLLTSGFVTAGDNPQKKCGTVEFNKRILENNPQYKTVREDIERFTKNFQPDDNLLITIPIVIHVLWNTAEQNISDAQIQSQIDVMNQDFARLNPDTINTPAPFKSLAANTQIQFCLAQRTPDNQPTTGVTRTQTNVVSFSDDSTMFFTSMGGLDIWDRDRYMNIYVVNFTDPTNLGFAQFPGMAPEKDGMVIGYRYFGNTGTVTPPNDGGRTVTHEVGHWLNLFHIWGDEPACAQDDEVADTPLQGAQNGGCPTFPFLDACSPNAPGVMYSNYMDYVDDNCMNIFTIGQSARMNAALMGPRASILTSNACQTVGIIPISSAVPEDFVLGQNYPNPFNPNTTITFSIKRSSFVTLKIFDISGKEVGTIVNENVNPGIYKVDWFASNLPSGIYLYSLQADGFQQSKKLILAK